MFDFSKVDTLQESKSKSRLIELEATDSTPKSGSIPNKFEDIFELFSAASCHIKQVGLSCGNVPFGAINELRYAGHHLLNGLIVEEHGRLDDAEREFD